MAACVVGTEAGGRLGWPVRHGGTVVLQGDDEVFTWKDGTEADRRFEVASVSKLLTALAVLVAVEQGKLDLAGAVPAGLELPPGVDRAPRQGSVTVRHLLAHASGMPFRAGMPLRAPGTRRVYSNPGYRLVAAVAARAVGTPFAEWLQRTVLRPLGMGATTLEERHGIPEDPAAGIVSTLPDLALLASCLLDRGAPVIGPELFAEAVTVQFAGLSGLVPGVGNFEECGWGLGPELKGSKRPHWMGERRSPSSFGHFGSSGCFLWVDPAAGVAAAAVTDRDFDHDRWAMRTWPAWSDELPSA
jgi:CubicO group peptidase (beta-lactamase class C family)